MRAILFLAALALLAGCAEPLAGRVADRLVEAGLSEPVARCMALRWTERLSIFQLNRISGVASSLRDEGGRLTVARFITRIRELDDPEIKVVVTRSAAICALTA